jgi:protein phosphatase
MRLRVAGRTDVGQKRAINEDAFACHPEIGVLVVCDGMGGEAAGEIASQLAVETISRQLNGADSWARGPTHLPTTGFLPRTRRLESALQLSNRAIYEQARKVTEQTGMGTTVVGAWMQDNLLSLAHVGDSRAYLWRHGSLERLTNDHSLVEEMLRAGLWTPEQARTSKQQSVLLRVLGREPEVDVDLAEIPILPGDYLLMCSDGLNRMVPDEELANTITRLRDPAAICESLIAQANQNGGVDNITVVVAEVREDGFWRKLWKALWK